MKKLNIPFYRQTQESDCLATCARTVMEYYGHSVDYVENLKQFDFYSMGLCNPQIGRYLIDNGFKVEIDTLNPYLFTLQDINKSQTEIYTKLKNIEIEDPSFEKIRQYFLTFMEKGRKLNPVNITKKIIVNELDQGRPVILPMVTNIFHAHRKNYNFHSNVIYGYQDNNFLLQDPALPENGGGLHVIDQDLVLTAFHMIGYADFDNASIIRVSK